MGLKYCPFCKEIVIAKAQLNNSQTVIDGIPFADADSAGDEKVGVKAFSEKVRL